MRDDTQSNASGLDDGFFAQVRGLEQWVSSRGRNRSNPALLIIPGPGAGLTRMAPFFAPWEQDYTLVQWDQPRAGATLAKLGIEKTGEYSFERIASDGIAVAELVCRRLGVRKVALLCMSGGSITGLMMVKSRPDLFSAYVAVGQIVNWARQDVLSYQMVLEQAHAAGNAAAVTELEGIGSPPYADAATDAIKSKYGTALTAAEQGTFASVDPAVMGAVMSPPPDASYLPAGLTLGDVRTEAMAAYTAVRSDLVSFDARSLGLDFAVPMFFLQGDADAITVSSEVRDYAADVRAPVKAFVSLDGGGHSVWFMRDAFLKALNEHVRPVLTSRTGS